MDEEPDPDEENVNSVLAQESSELLHILSSQSHTIIMKLCQMMPSDAGWTIDRLASSPAAVTEHIKAVLKYFSMASAADCSSFLQSMCLLCDNMPLHLESRLMSVAGYRQTDATRCPAIQTAPDNLTDVCRNSSPSTTDEKPLSPPSEQQHIKRPRIDHWEQYTAAVKSLLLMRWAQLSKRLLREVQLENVWVGPRTANRGKDKPDQTPGSADRGGRTPEPDGDYGFVESRVTMETFLQGCTGKVTVLFGQAGSGKTVLMSCLGQQWASGLGPIPSSYLFVLLEFRQLNLLSRPLSLSELLFRQYLPPKGGVDAKRAIVDCLLSNPEQSCWVLDGYDEFHSKLTRKEVQGELLDPEKPLPVAELISALLNRQLLPGCTVLVTCRVRDVIDLESISEKVGQLVGWDCREIKEYVHNFFGVTGHSAKRAVGVQAADLLLSTRHLLTMASLPALCNICCICLEYLLLEGSDPGGMKIQEEREETVPIPGGGSVEEASTGGTLGTDQGGERREREDIMMDLTNGRAQLPPASAQIPSTLTQVYLSVIDAFLSHKVEKKGLDTPKTMRSPQSTTSALSRYRSELCELSELAWKGLEDNKILFMEEDISQEVLEFSVRTGLLLQVQLRREDGMLVSGYCFVHLTVQEFLAALRIMTSRDVSDTQLKKRFSLKTRWMTKSDQRTVFTESLHLFVCGLASQQCTPALLQLARTSCGTGGQNWVQNRQNYVLKLLKNLCHSNALTGPKMLELCHCIQESQDQKLAQEILDTRPTLELRNIRLLPTDIDALAFVVNSVDGNNIGLDFGACSMELECLDVLPRCQHIQYLCFRGRKYGDKFAEKVSSILPKFTRLRKFEFCGASLTATGAASLATALQNSPDITEINLSDNNLKDEGIEHIADIFTKLPRLVSVMLGRNNSSLRAVDYLIGKMSSCLNIQLLHADGMMDMKVSFTQKSDLYSHKTEPAISLLNQKWSKPDMEKVALTLARCPIVSVLDLSGGQWDVEILRTLTQFLPKFIVTKKIIGILDMTGIARGLSVNDSCSTVDDLVTLTALLSNCPAVIELHIRLQSPVQVSIVFPGGCEKPADEISKMLCLSCCDLLPDDLDRVWKSLGPSSDLKFLDLSSNHLGSKGLKKLLEVLPRFRSIQKINASDNEISMDGLVMLAGALCSHKNLTQIHIRDGGREQLTLQFFPHKSANTQQPKVFRVNKSSLLPSDITKLCRKLVQCRSSLELDLSHSSLTDDTIENLLKVLPKMTSLQKLDISHSITTTAGALMLLSCLTISQRVTSVEIRPQTESFIQFDSVKAERASCRLTHFNLNGDDLQRLVKILQQGPQLSHLDLSSNQLQDEGVKCILDCLPQLQITSYVNLSNNSLAQQGLLDVADSLCSCGYICSAEVSLGAEKKCLIWCAQNEGCGKTLCITDSSLERDHLFRLAGIVSVCPSLIKVEFRNNSLQSDWIADFVKVLNSSRTGFTVSIEEDWIASEEAVSLACRCLNLSRNIHTVSVDHTTLQLSFMTTELTSVSHDPAVMATQRISFVDCAIAGHQLESMMGVIQGCPLLTELELVFSQNSFGVNGAEFLTAVLPLLPNLTSLRIGSKGVFVTLSEELSVALLQATTIHCLSLSGHRISDTAAQIMTKILPRLRSLSLSQCIWSATAGLQLVKALGECASLEGLCLNSLQLNEDSRVCLAQALTNIKSIRRLKLCNIYPASETSGTDLLTALKGLTKMEEIELEGFFLADRAIEQLSKLLFVWMELRRISLSKNHISDPAGEKLLKALNSCGHLEELHLSGNKLGDLTAARMAAVTPSLTHITVLDISENCIGPEGSESLSKAIMCMKKLTKIHLTSVGTSELCAVAASLAHCPLIQDVGLGWNNCGDEVAVELARVMPLCLKLTKIDLESNRVTVSGAKALLSALKSCPALKIIRLWKNQVPPSEADQLILRDRRLNFSST